ncbi:hypothetical protein BDW22DRAFT_1482327 [Trametopsis cervina]|nr:hypothetical protein BDW22DRAFT_1482327 [Trametopsis cervina]
MAHIFLFDAPAPGAYSRVWHGHHTTNAECSNSSTRDGSEKPTETSDCETDVGSPATDATLVDDCFDGNEDNEDILAIHPEAKIYGADFKGKSRAIPPYWGVDPAPTYVHATPVSISSPEDEYGVRELFFPTPPRVPSARVKVARISEHAPWVEMESMKLPSLPPLIRPKINHNLPALNYVIRPETRVRPVQAVLDAMRVRRSAVRSTPAATQPNTAKEPTTSVQESCLTCLKDGFCCVVTPMQTRSGKHCTVCVATQVKCMWLAEGELRGVKRKVPFDVPEDDEEETRPTAKRQRATARLPVRARSTRKRTELEQAPP